MLPVQQSARENPMNSTRAAEVRLDDEALIRGFRLWRGALAPDAQRALVDAARDIARAAPFYVPVTRGGRRMSVRMTNAGRLGWFTDRAGYRYAARHPSGAPWPPIPGDILAIWHAVTGLARPPDCCLVNFYGEGARMGLHRDEDEGDVSFPVLSISLGDDALFRIGGTEAPRPTESFWLHSGDILMIGGEARLAWHGVDRIRHRSSRLLEGGGRINLTLRVVGEKAGEADERDARPADPPPLAPAGPRNPVAITHSATPAAPDRAPEETADHARMVAIFRELAIRAGRLIMDIRARADLHTREKADHSPVTLADESASRLITRGLRRAFPAIPVISEEDPASQQESAATFIIVDPLDGTVDFIRGAPDFTVNIALVRGVQPVLGVILAPMHERLFYTTAHGGAVEEKGAFNPLTPGPIVPIRATGTREHEREGAPVIAASKSHYTPATDAYVARQHPARVLAIGSSLKFCLVAAGEADLYPRLGRTMEWDTAAGDAILGAAGGRVLSLADGAPLRYGKRGLENPSFVALAGGIAPI